jgi:replicative DNA helicase Mcm
LNSHTLDPSINQRVTELSKDPDIIHKLVKSFAPNLYGLNNIKMAILYHLVGGVSNEKDEVKSRGTLHVLLIGDPGTGKTKLLEYAQSLSDVISISGTGVNNEGLAAMVTIDQTGTPSIIEGALAQADEKHLHIDKLDKMNPKLMPVLETAMEQQIYPIARNGITTCLDTRISVLATSNPTLGRYNSYQTIAQNINLPVGLLTCFDLIFIQRDIPDDDNDRRIAEKILEIIEVNTDELTIPKAFLVKYLESAAQMNPKLSHEAKRKLRDFYLNMRRASLNEGAVSITPRQLQSLIRISEANAKLHLRDTVYSSDVDSAIQLFTRSMEQVGIDPITHHYDIDVLYTGRPTVLNSDLFKVVEAFSELEKISVKVSETDLQNELFERYGMNRRTLSRLLRTLLKERIIASSGPGFYIRVEES